MNCAQAGPLLGAHLDHELDVRTSLELEAHLRECAACRARLEDLRALAEAARAQLSRFAPSPAFEARLAAAIGGRAAPRRVWLAAAGATLAAAALLLLFVRRPEGPDRRLADEIVDAHIRSLLVDHVTDVQSTDQHTVKPWFDGKLPFGVPVADLAAAGFALEGGRVDYVGGREVAALVYRRRKHVINAFVWPQAGEAAPGELTLRGYSAVHFAHAGFTWWLVSDASLADLRELEARLAGSGG